MKRLSILALGLVFGSIAASARTASAATCDRACLTPFIDRYLDALLAHAPSKAPLTANVVYTENGTRVTPGEGLWKTATKIRTRREVFADATTGEAAFWGVVEENGAPLMLSLR